MKTDSGSRVLVNAVGEEGQAKGETRTVSKNVVEL